MASIVAQPKVTFNIVGANTTVPNEEQKILVVAQKTTGSAPVDTLLASVASDETSLDDVFGSDSLAAGIIRAIRALNAVTRIDVYLMDNTGGTAAEGLMTFVASSPTSGSVFVTVGSEIDYTFELAITTASTPTTIGDDLVTAMTASELVPATAVNVAGAVTFTATNPGVLGDQIGLQMDATDVSGVTIAPALSPMGVTTAGVDSLTFTTFESTITDSNVRYQTVVWPYSDTIANMDIITGVLDPRFNVDNDVLDGVAIAGRSELAVGTFTTPLTGLSAGQNSQSLTLFADKTEQELSTTAVLVFSKPAQFELDWVKAAQFAAIRALRLTDGQNISQFVIAANGPLDTIGGPALASKPYFNTPMPDLPSIAIADGWTQVNIENLLTSGASIMGINSGGTSALVGEVVTTYKTDAASNPDISFKFLNFVDTASNVREYFFNNNKSRFSQSRLTTGDVIGGRAMANAETIEAFQSQLYQDLSGEDFVLVQAGETALTFFKDSIVISIDLANGRVTLQMTTPLVTQLREILATMQIAFSTEG